MRVLAEEKDDLKLVRGGEEKVEGEEVEVEVEFFSYRFCRSKAILSFAPC